jgi:AcrR family transcriptional regulator
MLELGPASVQDIAKKAGVNRATTYVLIESLKRRGLVSSVDQGKKVMFAAESPQHLMTICEDEGRHFEEKKRQLMEGMPQLTALFNAMEEKPRVRFFEGEEGIDACREAVLELAQGLQSWSQFITIDQQMLKVAAHNEHVRLRFSSGPMKLRLLYKLEEGIVSLPKLGRNTEARPLPMGAPSFTGEFDIFETFIVVWAQKSSYMAVLIENREIAQMAKAMFELAWIAAKPPEKEKTLNNFLRAS